MDGLIISPPLPEEFLLFNGDSMLSSLIETITAGGYISIFLGTMGTFLKVGGCAPGKLVILLLIFSCLAFSLFSTIYSKAIIFSLLISFIDTKLLIS
jgi:hypothetical protein